jgi:hypothetical protein
MEGVLSIAAAIFGFLFIVKFPDEELVKPSKFFLSKDQLNTVTARIDADRADVVLEPFTWKRFLSPATEWFIYGFPTILMLVTVTANAFSFTLPIILRETLGFTIPQSQCLTMPPYFLALIVGFFAATLSDKFKTRGPVLVILQSICIVGLAILGWAKNPWVRYFGVFVTMTGSSSSISATTAYQVRNPSSIAVLQT